jgi:hypothetical protein
MANGIDGLNPRTWTDEQLREQASRYPNAERWAECSIDMGVHIAAGAAIELRRRETASCKICLDDRSVDSPGGGMERCPECTTEEIR